MVLPTGGSVVVVLDVVAGSVVVVDVVADVVAVVVLVSSAPARLHAVARSASAASTARRDLREITVRGVYLGARVSKGTSGESRGQQNVTQGIGTGSGGAAGSGGSRSVRRL